MDVCWICAISGEWEASAFPPWIHHMSDRPMSMCVFQPEQGQHRWSARKVCDRIMRQNLEIFIVSWEEPARARVRVAVSAGGGGHLPALQIFDAAQHVQVTSRVLLDHIHHVIRSQALLELSLGHQELHNAERRREKKKKKAVSETQQLLTGAVASYETGPGPPCLTQPPIDVSLMRFCLFVCFALFSNQNREASEKLYFQLAWKYLKITPPPYPRRARWSRWVKTIPPTHRNNLLLKLPFIQ